MILYMQMCYIVVILFISHIILGKGSANER